MGRPPVFRESPEMELSWADRLVIRESPEMELSWADRLVIGESPEMELSWADRLESVFALGCKPRGHVVSTVRSADPYFVE